MSRKNHQMVDGKLTPTVEAIEFLCQQIEPFNDSPENVPIGNANVKLYQYRSLWP
ncbi:hypothetical protein FACS1894104_3770 [Actinomycetota bacterium]|nr:hypothetical protein FACS1894104_3770 [Actinomycetota bacterium]